MYKLVKYLGMGLVSYLSINSLTYIFSFVFLKSAAISYLLSQVIVLLINFLVAREYIFEKNSSSAPIHFLKFLAGNLFFRGVDWLIFTFLFATFHIPIFVCSLISMSLVLPMKYLYTKKIFEA